MFQEKFKINQPFVSKFFEAALRGGTSGLMGQAYMFTGSDILAQYYSAIQLAKALNCDNKLLSQEDCNCVNCSWINQNRHPAVITISPIDFLYESEGGKALPATVIKISQARYLRKILAATSPYHRVIIFTDAVEGKEYEILAEQAWNNYRDILSPPPNDNESRTSWIPMPISYRIFQAETANSLLKTIEEPGSNLTFFFLTNDKEDMIDTIVSRCQVIPVLSRHIKKIDFTVLDDILNNLPQNNNTAMLLSEKFIDISKETNINIEELLSAFQEFFHQLIMAQPDNNKAISRFLGYIKSIEHTKTEIRRYVNAQSAIDSLFLKFVNDN